MTEVFDDFINCDWDGDDESSIHVADRDRWHLAPEALNAGFLFDALHDNPNAWAVDIGYVGRVCRAVSLPPIAVFIGHSFRSGPWTSNISTLDARIKFVERALERIAKLQALSNDPSVSGDDLADEDDPPHPLSQQASEAAIAIIQELASLDPARELGIFPTQQGGLALQTIGSQNTVTVEVPASGDIGGLLGKYAAFDTYHREILRDPRVAADFLVNNAK